MLDTISHSRLSKLEGRDFDVVIIGGGINGCTTALHLSMAGYSVLLVEKQDFGGGATARSGRTLHCGLQYLAPKKSILEFVASPGDFLMRLGVAKRVAQDYAHLSNSLAHRLQPMENTVPIFSDSPFRGWQVDLGARLVRLLSGGKANFAYRRDRQGSSPTTPFVKALRNPERLQSVVAFRDLRFHWPERIAIDNALSAEATGAVLRNFTTVKSLRRSDGLWHVELHDTPASQLPATCRARIVLNLAGAWVDDILRRITPTAPVRPIVTGVKGVYFLTQLLPEFEGRGMAGINRIGEAITCLPWGRFHYVGPTQTTYEGSLDDVVPDEASISFLLEELAAFLPGLKVGRHDVIMAWAGVRPITSSPGQAKGRWLPYSVIHDLGAEGIENAFSLTWGVLINHQSTAERLTKLVRSRFSPSASENKPAIPLKTTMPPVELNAASIRFCIQNEHARDLRGILFSRLGIGWHSKLTAEDVVEAATCLRVSLGWSQSQINEEVADFTAFLQRQHLISLS